LVIELNHKMELFLENGPIKILSSTFNIDSIM
jgi:hypothetical protein